MRCDSIFSTSCLSCSLSSCLSCLVCLVVFLVVCHSQSLDLSVTWCEVQGWCGALTVRHTAVTVVRVEVGGCQQALREEGDSNDEVRLRIIEVSRSLALTPVSVLSQLPLCLPAAVKQGSAWRMAAYGWWVLHCCPPTVTHCGTTPGNMVTITATAGRTNNISTSLCWEVKGLSETNKRFTYCLYYEFITPH